MNLKLIREAEELHDRLPVWHRNLRSMLRVLVRELRSAKDGDTIAFLQGELAGANLAAEAALDDIDTINRKASA